MESCHSESKSKRPDFLLWGSSLIVGAAYIAHLLLAPSFDFPEWLTSFNAAIVFFVNEMWWGLLLGILFVGVMSLAPREFIISIIGSPDSSFGVIRATAAGILLDLCSHGILLVGMNLYKRGASLGQTFGFLIASPWNSISLTIILVSLIGLKWTISFVLLSMLIAVIAGTLVNFLERKGKISKNPNSVDLPENFHFWRELKNQISATKFDHRLAYRVIRSGAMDSKMILKWILFGAVLASLIRTFVDTGTFETYFGSSLLGLGLTLVVATILEVCSEGSTPIAADLLNRANAPGNAFAFLMTGVSTDYTEILSLKETTHSWKLSFLLPLVTLPQVIAVSLIINYFA